MKTTINHSATISDRPTAIRAASRVGLLLALALGVILGGGGLWYWQQKPKPAAPAVTEAAPILVLSETTSQILAGIESPVEVWLFAPVDVGSLPVELGGYVTRVEKLLAEYERVAAGKLRVVQRDPQSDVAAKGAASAAGIVPFAAANGDIIYLGLTVGSGRRVETIAPLSPEWEAALESDISRAIKRVTAKVPTGAQAVTTLPSQSAPIDPATSEGLLRQFPDLGTRSYAEMAQTLREGAVTELKTAAVEMQTKVQLAQQALAEARQSKSAAEQQAALEEFQRVQAGQTAKLQDITARLQERLTVLQRLQAAHKPPAVSK